MTRNDSRHCVPDSNNSAGELQVAEYMEEMQEDSEENYNKHFSQYIAAELEGGDLEEKLQEVRSFCLSACCQCCQRCIQVSLVRVLCTCPHCWYCV